MNINKQLIERMLREYDSDTEDPEEMRNFLRAMMSHEDEIKDGIDLLQHEVDLLATNSEALFVEIDRLKSALEISNMNCAIFRAQASEYQALMRDTDAVFRSVK